MLRDAEKPGSPKMDARTPALRLRGCTQIRPRRPRVAAVRVLGLPSRQKWNVQVAHSLVVGGFQVLVEGQREDTGQVWFTSVIRECESPRELCTLTGSVYVLNGEMDEARTMEAGFTARFVSLFRDGFPTNWQALVDQCESDPSLFAAPEQQPPQLKGPKRMAKRTPPVVKTSQESDQQSKQRARKRKRPSDEKRSPNDADGKEGGADNKGQKGKGKKGKKGERDEKKGEEGEKEKGKAAGKRSKAKAKTDGQEAKPGSPPQNRRLSEPVFRTPVSRPRHLSSSSSATPVPSPYRCHEESASAIAALPTSRYGRRLSAVLPFWRGVSPVHDRHGTLLAITAGVPPNHDMDQELRLSQLAPRFSEPKLPRVKTTPGSGGANRKRKREGQGPVRGKRLRKPVDEDEKPEGPASEGKEHKEHEQGEDEAEKAPNEGNEPDSDSEESDPESLLKRPRTAKTVAESSRGTRASAAKAKPKSSARAATKGSKPKPKPKARARPAPSKQARGHSHSDSDSDGDSEEAPKPAPAKRLRSQRNGGHSDLRGFQTPRKDQEEAWSAEQLSSLQEALTTVNPTAKQFWDRVAELVPGKSAEQCRQHMYSAHPTPHKNTKGANGVDEQIGEFVKLARRGTIKRKQQSRALLQKADEGHRDDVFEMTPMRGRDELGDSIIQNSDLARELESAFDDSALTQPSPAPHHASPAPRAKPSRHSVLSPFIQAPDQKSVDSYIHRVQKMAKHISAAKGGKVRIKPASVGFAKQAKNTNGGGGGGGGGGGKDAAKVAFFDQDDGRSDHSESDGALGFDFSSDEE